MLSYMLEGLVQPTHLILSVAALLVCVGALIGLVVFAIYVVLSVRRIKLTLLRITEQLQVRKAN